MLKAARSSPNAELDPAELVRLAMTAARTIHRPGLSLDESKVKLTNGSSQPGSVPNQSTKRESSASADEDDDALPSTPGKDIVIPPEHLNGPAYTQFQKDNNITASDIVPKTNSKKVHKGTDQ